MFNPFAPAEYLITPQSSISKKAEKGLILGQPSHVARLKQAIAHNETGIIPKQKKYSFERHSNSSTLGYALGKYQITEGELGTYAKQYLGRSVNRDEFLKNPALQERYMDAKLSDWQKRYGMVDSQVLLSHFGGLNAKPNVSGGQDYIKKGLGFLGKL